MLSMARSAHLRNHHCYVPVVRVQMKVHVMCTRKRVEMREPQLSTLIAKELRSETNRRFLGRMPAFKAEQTIPDNLRALLERLENAERGPRAVRH